MAFTMRAQTQSEEMKSLWMDRFIDRKYPDSTTEVINFCMAGDEIRSYSKEWREMDPTQRGATGCNNLKDYIEMMVKQAREAANQNK